MSIERQYYGLVSALPALQLDNCPAPPWEALWQSAAPFVDAETYTLLSGLYLPYEHLPLLLGHLPPHHPYPLQHSPEQLTQATGLRLPYIDPSDLLALRAQPLADGLAQLQAAWELWIRGFEVELLAVYLDFSKALELYPLQWRSSEQAALQALLQVQDLPGLAALEDQLEQALLPGRLQPLVHSSHPAVGSRYADQLRWEWLAARIFHQAFGLEALLAYALRQQLSWQGYVAPAFDPRTLLETTVHEMLT